MKMVMKRNRTLSKVSWAALALAVIVMMLAFPAKADDKNGWVTSEGYCRYYVNRQALTGLQEINGNTYYFSPDGIQLTSWRQIGENYYCFQPAQQENGYMLKGTEQNGITLQSDGRAVLSSTRAEKKVKLMVRISGFLDKILKSGKGKWTTRRQKLKGCYDYLRKRYPYRFVCHFRRKDPNWDIWSANYLMDHGYADCHPYACTFAYLANALGYRNVTVLSWFVSKTGHSWVKLNGKIYDVSLGRHAKKSYRLFGISEKAFYRKYRQYKVKDRLYLDRL